MQSSLAQQLYHDFAAHLPIIDYHSHLPVDEIFENKNFETQPFEIISSKIKPFHHLSEMVFECKAYQDFKLIQA